MSVKKERIIWIDFMKCIGIFTIYLGHFADQAGKAYPFVFLFHVALFFFLSGCMNYYDKENNLLLYIKKRFFNILLPFYLFGLLSIAIRIMIERRDASGIISDLVLLAKGCVRNSFFSAGLWFLSCLFVMEVLFKLIKYLRYRLLILATSIVFFIIAVWYIDPQPLLNPHCLYNVDSMCYYIFFFAAGYCIYPLLMQMMKMDTKWKKIAFLLLFSASLIYSVLLFENISLLSYLPQNTLYIFLILLVQPMIVITCVCCVSVCLSMIPFLSKLGAIIGQNTLYLCGNEWIIKTLFPLLLGIWGIELKFHRPLEVYVYSGLLIIISILTIIPLEKMICHFIMYITGKILKKE